MFVQAAKGSFMREFRIMLRSVKDVQDFVSLATAAPFPVWVCSEQFQANGKSFMEMFCLDLTRVLTVSVECSEAECDLFRAAASRFMAF